MASIAPRRLAFGRRYQPDNREMPGNERRAGAQRPMILFAILVAGGLAALALFGWAFHHEILTRLLPGFVAMNPVTASVFLILAIAIVLQLRRQVLPVRLLAGLVIAVGMIKLGQGAVGWPGPIDQLFFGEPIVGPDGMPRSGIAAGTALALVLLGAALLASNARPGLTVLASQILGILAAAIALFVLTGYALDLVALHGMKGPGSMPLNSALAIMALAVAIIGIRRDVGLMPIICDRGPAGLLARIALPLALLVPVLVGLGRISGESAGIFGSEVGVALQVFANIIVTFTLLAGCIIVLFRSDSARRRRELAVAQSEGQYRHAEQVGHIGHWRIEYPSRLVQWSDEFREICGLSRDVAPSLDRSLALYHPDDAVVAREVVVGALKDGRGWEIGHRIRRRDGTVRHIKSHGVCERDERAQVTAIFGVFVDVTELESARREAEAATASKAAFLANMSHEIRTPMNGVMGFVELLMDSDLDAGQRRHLTLIQESAEALLKLLNDILDLSKIEAGQLDLNAEPSSVRHDIRQCVRLMTPIAEQKGLELATAMAKDFPAGVMVDSLRLRQILFNLLGNAVKFTNRGSVSVTLGESVDSEGERIMLIAVADTGVGIAAERKAAIFDAFVQADVSISRRFGGSGLGLSISRRLARLMGGSIALASEEGRGTVVTLALPLLPAAAPSLCESEAESAPPRSGPVRASGGQVRRPASILLVEDVDINQELITEMLMRLGHKVEIATNGAQALECARRLVGDPGAWDLILMDVQMPVMDGLTATRAIRALGGRAATIPIVALTANAFAGEMQDCRDAGMNDHIAKPSGFVQLKRAVERWAGTGGPFTYRTASYDGSRASLVGRFEARRVESGERLTELAGELATARGAAADGLLAEAASIAHVLAGTAGMFGQAGLGDSAREVEDELKGIAKRGRRAAKGLAGPVIARLAAALGATPSSIHAA